MIYPLPKPLDTPCGLIATDYEVTARYLFLYRDSVVIEKQLVSQIAPMYVTVSDQCDYWYDRCKLIPGVRPLIQASRERIEVRQTA